MPLSLNTNLFSFLELKVRVEINFADSFYQAGNSTQGNFLCMTGARIMEPHLLGISKPILRATLFDSTHSWLEFILHPPPLALMFILAHSPQGYREVLRWNWGPEAFPSHFGSSPKNVVANDETIWSDISIKYIKTWKTVAINSL